MIEDNLPPSYTLELLPGKYAICRLPEESPDPEWAKSAAFLGILRRPGELSIVCTERFVPPEVKAERGWRILQVAGQMDFSLVGVLASLLAPLARAEISVFVLSTYDTDLILVKESALDKAVQALQHAGHVVRTAQG